MSRTSVLTPFVSAPLQLTKTFDDVQETTGEVRTQLSNGADEIHVALRHGQESVQDISNSFDEQGDDFNEGTDATIDAELKR